MIPVRPALVAFLLPVVFLTAASLSLAQVSVPIVDRRAADSRLENVLTSRTSLTHGETKLNAFVEQLRRDYAIDVVLDAKALDDVGLGEDCDLKAIQLGAVTLEEGLQLVLTQLELTYLVRGEVLVITTPEEADSYLDTRVYPVADLVRVPSTRHWNAEFGDDYDSLIQVITSTLSPESWEDVGGANAIEVFPGSRSLVVSATRDVHRQIEGLLRALRASHRVTLSLRSRSVSDAEPNGGSRPYRSRVRDGHASRIEVNGPSALPLQGTWHLPARLE